MKEDPIGGDFMLGCGEPHELSMSDKALVWGMEGEAGEVLCQFRFQEM